MKGDLHQKTPFMNSPPNKNIAPLKNSELFKDSFKNHLNLRGLAQPIGQAVSIPKLPAGLSNTPKNLHSNNFFAPSKNAPNLALHVKGLKK
jgi:hypothetical protein